MSALHDAAGSVCAALLRVGWQAGLLIVVVLLVERALGRRLAPRWRYALWALVVVRLVLPAAPASAIGVLDWRSAPWSSARGTAGLPVEPADARASAGAAGAERAGLERDGPPPSPRAAQEERHVRAGGEGRRPPGAGEPRESGPSVAGAPLREVGAPPAARGPAGEPSRPSSARGGRAPDAPAPAPWTLLAALAWLLGALARLALLGGRELAFRRRLARAPEVRDPRVLALLEDCRTRLRLRRPVALVRSELAGSPAVTGLLRPRLLLPAAVLERLDDARLRHVLLHELAHVKRGDVARQALLALVSCAWWFHPLVGLALARLRAAQESLRDQEALSAEEFPAPFRYAETLLELLRTKGEGADAPALGIVRERRELRRRIEMIASFDERRNRRGVLGPGVCVALGWLFFTSAAPEAAPSRGPAPAVAAQDAGSPRRTIAVERHRPPEPWQEELRRRLQRDVRLDLVESDAGSALDFLRQVAEVDVVVAPDVADELGDCVIDLHTGETTVADALNLVLSCCGGELDWCLARGAVFVGSAGELPAGVDLRFYRIAPLIDGGGEEATQELLELVYALSGEIDWDLEGRRIELLDDLLVVSQDERGHRAVLAILEQLLNDGRPALDAAEQRRAGLVERLATTRVVCELDDEPAAVAVQQLSALLGVPVLLDPEYGDRSVRLHLRDATGRNALEWIADQVDVYVAVQPDHVRLGDEPALELRMYPVGELLASSGDPEELEEYVVELVRTEVEPELWDGCPNAAVLPWRDLLVVKATPEAQRGIEQLLAALRRARE